MGETLSLESGEPSFNIPSGTWGWGLWAHHSTPTIWKMKRSPAGFSGATLPAPSLPEHTHMFPSLVNTCCFPFSWQGRLSLLLDYGFGLEAPWRISPQRTSPQSTSTWVSDCSLSFFRWGCPGLGGSLQLDFHGRGTEGEKGGKSEPQMPTQARQRGEGPATPHLIHPSTSKTEDDQVGLNGCTSFSHFKKEAQHVTTIHVQRIGKLHYTPWVKWVHDNVSPLLIHRVTGKPCPVKLSFCVFVILCILNCLGETPNSK